MVEITMSCFAFSSFIWLRKGGRRLFQTQEYKTYKNLKKMMLEDTGVLKDIFGKSTTKSSIFLTKASVFDEKKIADRFNDFFKEY